MAQEDSRPAKPKPVNVGEARRLHYIYRLERDGRFPKRVRIGPNRVAWLADEVSAWLNERVAERDAAPVKGA